MTTAPLISRRVTDMEQAFRGCISLSGTIIIHADVLDNAGENFYYADCFYGTAQPIALVGTSSQLGVLADTSSKGNVTVKQ
jgi:hypothetical protein